MLIKSKYMCNKYIKNRSIVKIFYSVISFVIQADIIRSVQRCLLVPEVGDFPRTRAAMIAMASARLLLCHRVIIASNLQILVNPARFVDSDGCHQPIILICANHLCDAAFLSTIIF